mmetsp:Transcript_32458/g.74995  ORF Transcript_32458/g.74995 Transcript_32458/m.74995 type:complete len:958 (-) Transcript_32458:313-3186(-)
MEGGDSTLPGRDVRRDVIDDSVVEDLFDTCAGLGDYHKVDGKDKYLYRRRDECLTCLQDLTQLVEKEDTGRVRAKLGEWQGLPQRIVPLYNSYNEDIELSSQIVPLLVLLTTRVGSYGQPAADLQVRLEQERDQLRHLQDYKAAFTKSNVFATLSRLLVEALDGEEAGFSLQLFKDVLFLLRNLVSVPDPCPGDAGFTPQRRRMQLAFIRHFSGEGLLSFFLLLSQQLTSQQDENEDHQQVWALADIIYHVCTHFDPQELFEQKEQSKSDLADLLARDKADRQLLAPTSTRHGRFGTSMHVVSGDGSVNISSTVLQNGIIPKSGALLKREFRNADRAGKKENMFHNPFFVDLAEGSVREHNQFNPHVRGALDDRANHPHKLLQGYRQFFEHLCSSHFSSLVGIMRKSCRVSSQTTDTVAGTEFNMLHLLNFISWFLEFHRCQHAAEVAKAKKANEPPPDMDIAVIQGAIDVDMIQFTTARLRDLGKVQAIHSSLLVIVLRALSQQIHTIQVLTESTDSDTRDCADMLVRHLLKEDVMGNISWVMRFFKSSAHDPRVLSYSVEAWHNLTSLMKQITERGGGEEFQVERLRGVHMTRSMTSVDKEVADLADSRTVGNLFHFLEKYRRHTPAFQTMLVHLIRSIMDARPTNIVLFFELSYFMRIHRIMTDPLLTSTKNSVKYKDLTGLLRFILREFFKCSEHNPCAFAELLFPKVHENAKDALESQNVEFAAILSNYEEESYKGLLDRMFAGETVNELRQKQRQLRSGDVPWTAEEDAVLRERYAMYADHPLCADLLTADLPEDSRRTALQVRKRLVELGLMMPRGRAGGAEEKAEGMPPSKKAKVADEDLEPEEPAGEGAAPPAQRTQHDDMQDEEMLEEDLERLLDAAYDSLPTDGGSFEAPASIAPTAQDEASAASLVNKIAGEASQEVPATALDKSADLDQNSGSMVTPAISRAGA